MLTIAREREKNVTKVRVPNTIMMFPIDIIISVQKVRYLDTKVEKVRCKRMRGLDQFQMQELQDINTRKTDIR